MHQVFSPFLGGSKFENTAGPETFCFNVESKEAPLVYEMFAGVQVNVVDGSYITCLTQLDAFSQMHLTHYSNKLGRL